VFCPTISTVKSMTIDIESSHKIRSAQQIVHEATNEIKKQSLTPQDFLTTEYYPTSTLILDDEQMKLEPKTIKPKKWSRKLFIFRSCMYGLLTLDLNFSTLFVVATLIPIQVMEMVGVYRKEAAMTIVAIMGAILPSFAGMITVYLLDHDEMHGVKNRLGKRKPFMILGIVLWINSIMLRSWLYFHGDIGSSSHQFQFVVYCFS
jgi:hypothetical protein